MRSAVSRFLTVTLDNDKYHPFRRDVIKAFPKAAESPGRVPDLSPEVFWEIVDEAPEYLRASYVTLAATGMRVGEYLALEEHHLLPVTKSIRVPGGKTAGSSDTIAVGDEAWQWARRAVPSPIGYKSLYRHWKEACEAAGVHDVWLHDLRHFYGQQLTNKGRPEASVQSGLRHADPNMTRRYTRQRDRRENADMMDAILFPAA